MATPRRPVESTQQRTLRFQLVRDHEHVDLVVEQGILRAQVSIWIATANLKDLHIAVRGLPRSKARHAFVSLFDKLKQLADAGVDVRILHAGPPSRVLAQRLRSTKKSKVALRRCPRVHLKMVAVDGTYLYLGSANFTGAGLGAKGDTKRNFEAGIWTEDDWLLDEMQGSFDALWDGKHCAACRLRAECPKPIDTIGGSSSKHSKIGPRDGQSV